MRQVVRCESHRETIPKIASSVIGQRSPPIGESGKKGKEEEKKEVSFKQLRELTTVQGWELFWALMFHNFTIILAAWIGFVIGARTMEMDEMERFLERSNGENWRKGGS